ncbi:aminotransferase class I/II-fold pyridoxal phosphate-dependent enzyme [Pediococcus claussenii]|uniref:Aminotransferase n=1 Tax=Pediococcus claussenii (strain ATCC BAA-344 / DSM 14800 / JCM 18046 / KCTC 3811 / LMG 21948 / P06) TaxID=701521 RepID=G8PEU0_PEDCP|nr:aminotransferase class I/II-fold pyridoxal phosphate-dependent enzyme [Pediococcus claussenii]AEV94470.1 aminotransferase class-V family protein [Pediococcus claussenii ATCC BAA-344]ANZ69689.1 aromatic amino acid aminotransferase [Pediococcus claussenii]ANZ71506.1 aromatic amino acid aminotransferase [Pediococcus claussenii]KRN19822.1 hypothetical protein IV79_GL001111 [Pediococcus claussenii]
MPELKKSLHSKTRKSLSQIGRSAIRQFDQEVSSIPGILKLTLGEPDLDTPDHIKDALISAVQQNQSHYAAAAGNIELRTAISNYLKKVNKIKYNPNSEIIVTVGATEAIYSSMTSLLESGDGVIIPTPAFPLYSAVAIVNDAVPIEVDTSNTDFVLTPDVLEDALQHNPNTKMVVLNYPTNPTGVTYSRQQLAALAKVLKKYSVFVLVDEIYCELNFGAEHASITEFIPDQTILINGVSKSYAMTGYRVGYLAAPKQVVTNILKLHGFAVTTVPTTIMVAATEAIEHGDADIIRMKQIYSKRRDYIVTEFKKMGFSLASPQGAFYLFAKIPDGFPQNSRTFAVDLAQNGKLALVPGVVFGPGGEGYVRLSYAASMDHLKEAVSRMHTYLNNWRKNNESN